MKDEDGYFYLDDAGHKLRAESEESDPDKPEVQE